MEHGTRSTYVNHRCRCEPCRRANGAALLAWRVARRARQAAEISEWMHGKVSTYLNFGCRCERCKLAHNQQRRRLRRITGS